MNSESCVTIIYNQYKDRLHSKHCAYSLEGGFGWNNKIRESCYGQVLYGTSSDNFLRDIDY